MSATSIQWQMVAFPSYRSQQLREGLGKAAREHATRNFCASKIVLQYEELYRRTIEESGSPVR